MGYDILANSVICGLATQANGVYSINGSEVDKNVENLGEMLANSVIISAEIAIHEELAQFISPFITFPFDVNDDVAAGLLALRQEGFVMATSMMNSKIELDGDYDNYFKISYKDERLTILFKDVETSGRFENMKQNLFELLNEFLSKHEINDSEAYWQKCVEHGKQMLDRFNTIKLPKYDNTPVLKFTL